MSYKGKALSRKELAKKYNVSLDMFNKWLKEINSKISLGKRRILSPKEISKVIEEWGSWE
ncbi:MAG: hypothetical protein ACK40G_13890 [Cytophagaceae bacterium]